MSGKMKIVALAAVLVLCAMGAAQAAQMGGTYDANGNLVLGVTQNMTGDVRLQHVADWITVNIKPWLNDPLIVSMVNAQNADYKKMSGTERNTLDNEWIKRSNKKLIDSKMNNKLSTFLRKKRDALKDVVMEIFVFDKKGLNVGQTDLTQDFDQGDETKFWKSYGSGPNGEVVETIGPDGGRPRISQVTLAIKDPATGKAIGGMTVGLDYDGLVKTMK